MASTVKKTRYTGVYLDIKGHPFYQINLGKDKQGKSHTKKSRFNHNGKPFESIKEAYEERERVRQEYKAKMGKAKYCLTYKMFMEQDFLPYYRANVEESTYHSHINAFKKGIEFFGKQKLEDIKVQDCEDFRTWLLGKSGFSQNYASLIYSSFRQSLGYAVRMELLQKNVAMQTKAVNKAKTHPEVWTKKDFEKVLSQISLDDYYSQYEFIVIWFYYMTGVRVSEGLALQWSDINFKNRTVKVYHTLDFKNVHEYRIKPYTKTQSGQRVIMLDQTTIKYLKRWKMTQVKQCKTNFVLSYKKDPVPRSTVNRIIKRYSKLAEVPEINGKGLRHSHVSYLINEIHANILVISKRLGHSSPDITLKHYAHMWAGSDEAIAKELDKGIQVKTAKEKRVKFIGNQNVKVG